MEYVNELIARYKKKGILVDTNLLLLYLIGQHDPDRIPRFKRTTKFTIDEFILLALVFKEFDKIVTTPNILTEVSNLTGQLPEELRSVFYSDFAGRIALLHEEYTSSDVISVSPFFNRFGLTDSGLIHTVKGRYLALTDDLKLFGLLQSAGIDSLNFNHIRMIAW